jgi:hypothetical protein
VFLFFKIESQFTLKGGNLKKPKRQVGDNRIRFFAASKLNPSLNFFRKGGAKIMLTPLT